MNAVVKPAPVTFAVERARDLWDQIVPLLEMHYKEIAKYQDIELAPAIDEYNRIDDLGMLRCYTARKAGVLIGYAVFFVKHNMHYSKSLQAVQDVIYLDPAYRGGRTGLTLLRYSENRLREEGVQVVIHHVKQGHPALGRVLEFLGYEVMDLVYTRRLD